MLRWGLLITGVYALLLLGLIIPGTLFLWGLGWDYKLYWSVYRGSWIFVGVLLGGQALLLFLSVDTSRKRLKPRVHVLVSCSVAAILTALLTVGAILSLGAAAQGDKFGGGAPSWASWAVWGVLWLLWGTAFYLYFRNSSQALTRLISWLLKGSVLELLIVVPCHIIVRRRHDCSAPLATSLGITTGIAIMLLSFGPGILLLYKKRLDGYAAEVPKQGTL